MSQPSTTTRASEAKTKAKKVWEEERKRWENWKDNHNSIPQRA